MKEIIDKTYDIHDNGLIPFRVSIKDSKITVVVHEEDSEEDSKEIYSTEYDTVYIPEKGTDEEGNSILVQQINDEYIYIGGHCIKKISIPGGYLSIEYRSPIGNNDVPYPWIRVEYEYEIYYYLVIENVKILDKKNINHKKYSREGFFDPYSYYYDNSSIARPKSPGSNYWHEAVPDFMNISLYKINGEEYNYSYHPNHDSDYERIKNAEYFENRVTEFNEQTVVINKQEKVLTKKMNYEIMNTYGNIMGFSEYNSEIIYLQ